MDKNENQKLKIFGFADIDTHIETKRRSQRSKTITKSDTEKPNLNKYKYNLQKELNKHLI